MTNITIFDFFKISLSSKKKIRKFERSLKTQSALSLSLSNLLTKKDIKIYDYIYCFTYDEYYDFSSKKK
jgi:hypothetical protein